MALDKFRIRFRKVGDLRLLSHHDLMRTFERMLRRAGLPFRSTEGFHPKPRMVFALSLPLGVAGLDEVVEVELTEERPAEEVLSRLSAEAPSGLDLLSIRRIPLLLTGQVIRAVYSVELPPKRREPLFELCANLLDQPEIWVERSYPNPKRVNIRPYLLKLRVGAELEITLRVTPTGSARADEILALLGLSDILEAGAILERTSLEILDETQPVPGPSPVASGFEPQHAIAKAGAVQRTTDN